jgi:Phage Mu protein F like protein
MPVSEIDYSRISFTEALDYLSEKTNLDTDSYIEGQGLIQDVAFTVAAAKGQLLQDIRDALDRSISNGESVDKFLVRFNNIAASYTDDWPLKGGNSWRGALIYQQNIRQAYNAGRYAQMTDPDVMKLRPYWQWRHGNSEAPRLNHLALDGRVFRADSLPFHPPAGFNCACSVFSLSQRDVDKRGLEVEDLEMGQDLEVVDPSNGQTKTVQLKPDKGFDRIPGKSTPEQRDRLLKRLDPELRKAVEREAGMSWKPLMSKAEAEEYTKDSYYQGRDFYHGTDAGNLKGLASEGARLESERVNTYGDGFYLAFSEKTGINYANQADRPALVSARVRVRNPKKFADSIDFEGFLDENNIPADDFQSKAVTRILISQGFDAAEVGGDQILVIIFNRKQIAIYEAKEL